MPVIVCPACHYENEASRRFCHNCGVRLPRPAEQSKQGDETNRTATDQARRKLAGKHRVKPPPSAIQWRGLLAEAIVNLIHLSVVAAGLAAVLLMFRPPADLPPPVAPQPNLAQAGDAQLLQAASPSYSGTLAANAEQISAYLAAKLSIQAKNLSLGWSEVERSFVVLGPQEFRFGLLYRILGLPVALQSKFRLSGESGQFGLEAVGGTIGRLPVHPLIFNRVFRWFEPIRQAMEPQLETLARAQRIDITPVNVEVQWAGQSVEPSQPASPLWPQGSGLRSFP